MSECIIITFFEIGLWLYQNLFIKSSLYVLDDSFAGPVLTKCSKSPEFETVSLFID